MTCFYNPEFVENVQIVLSSVVVLIMGYLVFNRVLKNWDRHQEHQKKRSSINLSKDYPDKV